MKDIIARAFRELQDGKIVLVYDADGREEETDMIAASEHINDAIIRTMRKDAGGLICATVPPEARRCLVIP